MFCRLSLISTMSAVSMATSVPAAPMAMPTVAVASAGASFTPSPTMATGPMAFSSLITRTLSSGSRSAWNSSTPACFAMARGDAGVVAGEHDDALDAVGFELLDHGCGIGAQARRRWRRLRGAWRSPALSSSSPTITQVLPSSCKVAICAAKASGMATFCAVK